MTEETETSEEFLLRTATGIDQTTLINARKAVEIEKNQSYNRGFNDGEEANKQLNCEEAEQRGFEKGKKETAKAIFEEIENWLSPTGTTSQWGTISVTKWIEIKKRWLK